MTVWKPSATSPEGLEVVPLAPSAGLPSDLRIEVPSTWSVVFSSQKNTLTVGPLVEESELGLSSHQDSETSLRVK